MLPRQVVEILGIKVNDPVEIRVLWEGGGTVELITQLRRGLTVQHVPGDDATADLLRIPADTGLTVSVWRDPTATDPPSQNGGERPQPWTAERFDDDIERRNGSEVLRRARRVRDWAEARGLRLWWGRGWKWGGWVAVFDSPSGYAHSLFEMWTGGNLEVQFVYLGRSGPFADIAKREELRQQLNTIPGIALPPDVVDRRQSFWLAELPDDAALDRVLATFDWVLEELRGAPAADAQSPDLP
jgi:hypothetical protein